MRNCKRLPFLLAPSVLTVLILLSTLLVTEKETATAAEPKAAPRAAAAKAALKIAYSDWPGWLVWEIAKQKGFFKDAGVNVDLEWFGDYGASIDAYTAGKLDGICIVCGDSLQAKSSVVIVLTDFSEGNDMIIGKEGINS